MKSQTPRIEQLRIQARLEQTDIQEVLNQHAKLELELSRYRTALEQISTPSWAFDEAAKIARQALGMAAMPNDES